MRSDLVATANGVHNAPIGTAAPATASLPLPPEILAEIFLRMQEKDAPSLTSSESPLLLGQVCLDWRMVAWSTPSLWSNVDLCLSEERYSVQIELLDEWLQRSKAVPLTIRVWSIEREYSYWQSKKATEILRILIAHSWHWKNVNLYVPPQWDDDLKPVRDNLPILATLRVTHHTIPGHSRSFDMFQNAPSLHDVHLISVYVAEVTLPWHQLTTFRGDRLYVDECLTVLLYCPQMNKCHFAPIIDDYEAEQAHAQPRALTHNTLEWLEIRRTDGDLINFLLGFVTLPSLRRLGLGCDGRDDVSVSITQFIRQSGCILENLSMNEAVLSEEEAIVCFQDIPSLVEVQLKLPSDEEVSAKFLSALSSPDKPLLPNLCSLKLEGRMHFNVEELKEMLAFRWAHPEKFSSPVSRLKSLTIDSSSKILFTTEGYHHGLLEMVQDGLELSITSSYHGTDTLAEMARQVEGETNNGYRSNLVYKPALQI